MVETNLKSKEKTTVIEERNKQSVPKHIAIIMDGNRRWAKAKGKNSRFGHTEGYKRLQEISKYCKEIGVKVLTVYALSSENLKKRSKKELDGIFGILRKGLKKEVKKAMKENIKMVFLGRKEGLPSDIVKDMIKIEKETQNNTAGIFNLAINYGGRAEIVDAIKKIVKKNLKAEDINEKVFSDHLYTKEQDDPDLIIRTGGEIRMSNFLPWQATYAEYYFTKIFWPDFTTKEFDRAVDFYKSTQRNFGV